jgi:hypothetical protein
MDDFENMTYEEVIQEVSQVLNIIYGKEHDSETKIINTLEKLQFYRFVKSTNLLLPGRYLRYIDIREKSLGVKNAGFIVRYEPQRDISKSRVNLKLYNGARYRLKTSCLAMFVRLKEDEIPEEEDE